MTFGSNGTSYNRIGDMTFDNKGNWWNDGDFTFGSNGTSCQRIGSQTFCNR